MSPHSRDTTRPTQDPFLAIPDFPPDYPPDIITLQLDTAFGNDLELDSLPFKLGSIQQEGAGQSRETDSHDKRSLWSAVKGFNIPKCSIFSPFSHSSAANDTQPRTAIDLGPRQSAGTEEVHDASEASSSPGGFARLASIGGAASSKVTAVMKPKRYSKVPTTCDRRKLNGVPQATERKRLSRSVFIRVQVVLLFQAVRNLVHSLCGCILFLPSEQVSDSNSMHGSRISGCAIRFSGASDAVAPQPLSAAILAGVDEAIVHRNMSQSFKETSVTDLSTASTRWNQSSPSDRADSLRQYANIYDNLLTTWEVKHSGRMSQRFWEYRNLKCATCLGRCPICRTACCTYSAAQELLGSRAISRLHKKISSRLIEAVDCIGPPAESSTSFMLCTIKGGCGRRVCSNCCGICPNELCNDVQCKECKPDPWSECEWHAQIAKSHQKEHDPYRSRA